MEIRRARAADAAAIARALAAAFAEFAPAYTPAALAATTPPAARVRARLREGPIWVAVEGGAVVGTVSAVPRGAGVYVRSMAVLPAARGRGAGAALLREVERYARGLGATSLFLSTTPFLTQAIRLYVRHGFAATGDGPHDLHGTPLITMVKPLPPAESAGPEGY
jgi:ribosomal protein S18 acetylase RimI-like enzyme